MMLRSAILVAALVSTAAVPAFAALPPYYQRAREIQAILDSDAVREKLKQAPIDSITSIDTDVYDVAGGACDVEVTIVDVPPEPGKPQMVGPRKFTLDVGDADCSTGGD